MDHASAIHIVYIDIWFETVVDRRMTTIRLDDTPLVSMSVDIYQANIQQWIAETKDITRRLAKLTATIRTLTQANADDYVEGEKPSLEKLQQVAKSATENCAAAHRLLMHMAEDVQNFRAAQDMSILLEGTQPTNEMVAITTSTDDPVLCTSEEAFVSLVASSTTATNMSPSRSLSRASYPF